MRPVQLFLIFLFGGLTLFPEFQNIKKRMIFFDEELFNLLPLIILFILTVFYLVKNINQYHGNGKIITLIPALMGVMFLVLIFGHKLIRSHLDESETYFTAENYNIGNDGGITLDFKTNKHLKGFRIDHFSETYYWGSYTRYADTFELDIPLDFTKSKYAVLKRDTLYFIGVLFILVFITRDNTKNAPTVAPYPAGKAARRTRRSSE